MGERSYLVLVVEDEDTLREAVVDHLRNQGYHALAAADGVEALEVLHGAPQVGTVVCDLIMPRMGGRELARVAAKSFPDLAFVFMSGHSDQDLSRASIDATGEPGLASDTACRGTFLRKPFAMSALIYAITELNGAPQPSRPPLAHTRLRSDRASPRTIQ